MGILEKVEPAVWEVDPLVGEEGNCRYIWDVQESGEPVFFPQKQLAWSFQVRCGTSLGLGFCCGAGGTERNELLWFGEVFFSMSCWGRAAS